MQAALFATLTVTAGLCLGWAPQRAAAGASDEARLRELLAGVAARVYQPAQEGLVGLSFRLPYRVPAPIARAVLLELDPEARSLPEAPVHLATLEVSWRAGSEPRVEIAPVPPASQAHEILAEALLPQAPQRGLQVLEMVLGRPPDVEGLLRDFEPRIRQDAEGTLTAELHPRQPDQSWPLLRLEWTFGPDGLPRQTVTVSRLPVEPAGAEVRSTQTSLWRAVAPDDPRVVLERLATQQDAGPQGQGSTEIELGYEIVDGLLLLVELRERALGPGLAFESAVRLEDLVVERDG